MLIAQNSKFFPYTQFLPTVKFICTYFLKLKLMSHFRHLESDIRHLEQEKKSLSCKIKDLEKAILSPGSDNLRDKALRRLIAESPAPEFLKRMREDDECENEDGEGCHTPIIVSLLEIYLRMST